MLPELSREEKKLVDEAHERLAEKFLEEPYPRKIQSWVIGWFSAWAEKEIIKAYHFGKIIGQKECMELVPPLKEILYKNDIDQNKEVGFNEAIKKMVLVIDGLIGRENHRLQVVNNFCYSCKGTGEYKGKLKFAFCPVCNGTGKLTPLIGEGRR